MKISVTSWSFHRKIYAGEMAMIDIIKEAAALGIDAVEFTTLELFEGPVLDYAKRIREEAEKYNVSIVAYATGAPLFNNDEAIDAEKVKYLMSEVDVAAELGAPIMRHDVVGGSLKFGDRVISFDKQLPTLAKNARIITEYAASKGIRTCTENHGRICQDSDRVERLYNAVDHENYGVLVDIGNFICADEDSVRAVSRLAPYAIHAHAKDFFTTKFGKKSPFDVVATSRGCNQFVGCVVGEGDIPTAQCIAILKEAGYDGYISIEYEGREDCNEGIRRSYDNLKKFIG